MYLFFIPFYCQLLFYHKAILHFIHQLLEIWVVCTLGTVNIMNNEANEL